MRPIAAYAARSVVCMSECGGTAVNPANTDEPIEIPLCWPKIPCIRCESQWRHVANTIKRSVRGGNAALCQITLTTCSVYYCSQS